MDVQIRLMQPEDVEACGRICYDAFKQGADRHNFPPDHPSPAFSIQLAQSYCNNAQIFSIVAEREGTIVGSNYLTEYDPIRAVGPLTIDPAVQSAGVGKQLMQAVIDRGKGNPIRLVQDAFDPASLSLYTSLGFDVKEPLVVIEGRVQAEIPTQIEVRSLQAQDLSECADLCRRVHGIERTGDLQNTPSSLTSFVAVRDDRIVAYASAPHFWATNHAVAESEADMQALLAGVGDRGGDRPLSLLLPIRQSNLFRWCLDQGMRVIKPATLMTIGDYQNPHGCYFPSVGY